MPILNRAGLALCLLAAACGDKSGSAASASVAAPASAPPSASVVTGPKALAICDSKSPDEHVCFEFADEELATERARVCPGGVVRDAACPTKDRIGACRLPDGSARYGYPPRTTQQHEKHCKEARGKFSPTGVAPEADRKVLLSCRGKHKGACEEEETHTLSRADQARDDCAAFGGLFSQGEACPRDLAISLCDLEGKRTIVFYPEGELEEPDERKKFCEERLGRYTEIKPDPAASASAAPSASAPVAPP